MNKLDHDYKAFSEMPQPDEPLGTVFSRMAESGKDYARAELDRQKLRAGVYAAGVRDAGILLGAALVLSLAAIGALLVGLILALTPSLGAWGATAVVVIGTLIIAGVLVFLARARINRMTEATRT